MKASVFKYSLFCTGVVHLSCSVSRTEGREFESLKRHFYIHSSVGRASAFYNRGEPNVAGSSPAGCSLTSIAQLVEHLSYEQRVASSILAGCTLVR